MPHPSTRAEVRISSAEWQQQAGGQQFSQNTLMARRITNGGSDRSIEAVAQRAHTTSSRLRDASMGVPLSQNLGHPDLPVTELAQGRLSPPKMGRRPYCEEQTGF